MMNDVRAPGYQADGAEVEGLGADAGCQHPLRLLCHHAGAAEVIAYGTAVNLEKNKAHSEFIRGFFRVLTLLEPV